ncbi:H-NS family nucleoid-associated regulatory protein [Bradyrhizobium sp.]|jgi:DNA-binding protein H-NS|uniref:H-NS histone family protein n=1 Tax=Bradyrhizobium sp. TaxID=376 RepID=UPI003C238698
MSARKPPLLSPTIFEWWSNIEHSSGAEQSHDRVAVGDASGIGGEANMKNRKFEMMSADQLWTLHEEVCAILSMKLDAEKQKLENRLARLDGRIEHEQKVRRAYPKVHPKYRNPERPFETWSGRGKQPHWVRAQLRSGKKVDELLISRAH